MAAKMQAAVVETFGQPLSLGNGTYPRPDLARSSSRPRPAASATPTSTPREGDWPAKPILPFIPGHEAIGRVVPRHRRHGREGRRPGRRPLAVLGLRPLRTLPVRLGDGARPSPVRGLYENGGFADYSSPIRTTSPMFPQGSTAPEAAPLICAGVTSYKGIKETAARPGEWIVVSGVVAGGPGGPVRQGHGAARLRRRHRRCQARAREAPRSPTRGQRQGRRPGRRRQAGDRRRRPWRPDHGASLAAFRQGVAMTRKRGTCVLVGLPPGEFPVPLSTWWRTASPSAARSSARARTWPSARLCRRGQGEGRFELQPLSSINAVFDRLGRGEVPSRVVLEFGTA